MTCVHLPRKFHPPLKMSILDGFLVSGSALGTLGVLIRFWAVGITGLAVRLEVG